MTTIRADEATQFLAIIIQIKRKLEIMERHAEFAFQTRFQLEIDDLICFITKEVKDASGVVLSPSPLEQKSKDYLKSGNGEAKGSQMDE